MIGIMLIHHRSLQYSNETLNSGISERLDKVRERIRQAEVRYHREMGSVQLLAVSKTHPAQMVADAWNAGQRSFGESYIQEAITKMDDLSELDIEWHFIGRIQSNKTRLIAERFNWVHSVTSQKQLARLNDQRPPQLSKLKVLLQVNISAEESKSGMSADELPTLLDYAAHQCDRLDIVGLMAIPAVADDFEQQRRPFRALNQLRSLHATQAMPLKLLSMGMTADLEAAIAEGADIVRVGTAIFGPRAYNHQIG